MGVKKSTRKSAGGGIISVGAAVEVRSDDAGLSDAWYEATVQRSPPGHSPRGRVYVVYSTILDECDHNKPLAEFVRHSHVRPRPPRGRIHNNNYPIHHLVDAFHNDGWWPGVVTTLHPPDKYTVSFPGSREEILFPLSDLRPRLAWSGGLWCPPHHSHVVPEFSAGDKVEVSGDRDNFGIVWLPGTVLKVIWNTSFQVEYTVANDRLVEILDAQYIRQIPPSPSVTNFGVGDEVEAFHRCGWYVGVVSKVLDGSRYIVRLTCRDEEMEFHISKLRMQPKLIGGSWRYTPARKSTRQAAHAGKRPDLPLSVSSPSLSDDCTESINEQPLEMMFLNQNREKGPNIGGRAETLQPWRKRKDRVSADHLRVELIPNNPTKDIEHHASIPKFQVSPSSEFISATSPGAETGSPRKHSFRELSCGRTVSKLKCLNELLTLGEGSPNFTLVGSEEQLKKPNSDFSTWRRTKLAFRTPRRRREAADDAREHAREAMEGKEGSPPKKCKELLQSERTDTIHEFEHTREDANVSNAIMLWCPLDEPPKSVSTSDDNRDAQESNVSNILVDTLNSNLLFESSNQEDSSFNYSTQLTDSQVPNEMPIISFNTQVQEMSNFVNGIIDTENLVSLLTFKERSAVAIWNSFSRTVQQVPSPCEQLWASGNQVDCMALSLCEEGNKVNIGACTATSSLWNNFSTEEVMHNSPPTGSISVLPFEKESPLWKSIESMEVFHLMPRRPHFSEVEKYPKVSREGIAIGMMVTFVNLVCTMSRLHFSDSQATLKENLKELSSLEANGFEVQCVRSRMEELLEIGKDQEQSEEQNATLKGRILEREKIKVRLDAEDAILDKAIRESEQKIGRLRKERDSVLVQKKNNESGIDGLKKDLQKVGEAYLCAERRFDVVIASPWQ